ncbi:MAG: hypothetical protein ACI8RD_012979, partial [Bacillariaceae sp.]
MLPSSCWIHTPILIMFFLFVNEKFTVVVNDFHRAVP